MVQKSQAKGVCWPGGYREESGEKKPEIREQIKK